MTAFIQPPRPIPLLLRPLLWIAERIAGTPLLPARLLAWYPKFAVGSGILEALIARGEGRLDDRLLKLVRLTASFTVVCPFCIDSNSTGADSHGISADELEALRGVRDPDAVASLSARERLAIRFARCASETPLRFGPDLIAAVTAAFTPREIVILAGTAAQVNYWGRLIQALGVPAPGDRCARPDTEQSRAPPAGSDL
jgi:alkylhydroperoxidase family enzyme